MGTSLDLNKAHMNRPYGDIVAVFSWINDERALFLIPRYRKGAPWFIVMEPAAHTWSDQQGHNNIFKVIEKGQKACEVLGIEGNPANVRRLIGIVNDAIPDLVRMPTAPPTEYYRGAIGHMTMRANGEAFASEDIRMEREGAEYAPVH